MSVVLVFVHPSLAYVAGHCVLCGLSDSSAPASSVFQFWEKEYEFSGLT